MRQFVDRALVPKEFTLSSQTGDGSLNMYAYVYGWQAAKRPIILFHIYLLFYFTSIAKSFDKEIWLVLQENTKGCELLEIV